MAKMSRETPKMVLKRDTRTRRTPHFYDQVMGQGYLHALAAVPIRKLKLICTKRKIRLLNYMISILNYFIRLSILWVVT